ncbi:MAG: hypothetical protein ABR548_14075 [Actinomycetota bacterium]|nr:hypothetical protein [Actinomycetota bacterium]
MKVTTNESGRANLVVVVLTAVVIGALAAAGFIMAQRERRLDDRFEQQRRKLSEVRAALDLARDRGASQSKACQEARAIGDDIFKQLDALVQAVNDAVAALNDNDPKAFTRAALAETTATKAMRAARLRWDSAAARCTTSQSA